MESREAQFLKRKYKAVESSSSSSGGLSVKFSRLSDDIQQNFTDRDYSSKSVSAIIKEAFPHSDSR